MRLRLGFRVIVSGVLVGRGRLRGLRSRVEQGYMRSLMQYILNVPKSIHRLNSTLVRCSLKSLMVMKIEPNQFKFHTGSMLTISASELAEIQNGLNSTLVRCSLGRSPDYADAFVSLNSTLVRCSLNNFPD